MKKTKWYKRMRELNPNTSDAVMLDFYREHQREKKFRKDFGID